jgi:hypothetical protein
MYLQIQGGNRVALNSEKYSERIPLCLRRGSERIQENPSLIFEDSSWQAKRNLQLIPGVPLWKRGQGSGIRGQIQGSKFERLRAEC